jgi:hypothetical protein
MQYAVPLYSTTCHITAKFEACRKSVQYPHQIEIVRWCRPETNGTRYSAALSNHDDTTGDNDSSRDAHHPPSSSSSQRANHESAFGSSSSRHETKTNSETNNDYCDDTQHLLRFCAMSVDGALSGRDDDLLFAFTRCSIGLGTTTTSTRSYWQYAKDAKCSSKTGGMVIFHSIYKYMYWARNSALCQGRGGGQ